MIKLSDLTDQELISILSVHTSFRRRHRKSVAVRAARLLLAGYSLRETMRTTLLCKNTLSNIRRDLSEAFPLVCGCGREAGHSGWCWWRLNRSPKRKAFLAKWKRTRSKDAKAVNRVCSHGA